MSVNDDSFLEVKEYFLPTEWLEMSDVEKDRAKSDLETNKKLKELGVCPEDPDFVKAYKKRKEEDEARANPKLQAQSKKIYAINEGASTSFAATPPILNKISKSSKTIAKSRLQIKTVWEINEGASTSNQPMQPSTSKQPMVKKCSKAKPKSQAHREKTDEVNNASTSSGVTSIPKIIKKSSKKHSSGIQNISKQSNLVSFQHKNPVLGISGLRLRLDIEKYSGLSWRLIR